MQDDARAIDVSALQGWLIKYHNKESFFSRNERKRWFKVKQVEDSELALCYYKNR